jgi:maleamate amidohydrolase
MSRTWDDILTERDREVYTSSGYGRRSGGGTRPALLVIDVTHNFVGDRPEPIQESIKRFPTSCGEEGWQAMERIREVLSLCRALRVPIFYTKDVENRSALTRGSWTWKFAKALDEDSSVRQLGNQIPELIAPQADEIVIHKTKPSAFFGTPLASYLIALHVDTVLVTGSTTSGCVRASVIDAFSNNFRTIVIEEAVFDRGQASHKINLFDMNAKYADVISIDNAKLYLHSLAKAVAADASDKACD